MSLIMHSKPRAPTQRTAVVSRDSIRARLERTEKANPNAPRVCDNTRLPAGTGLIDLEAADRMIDFVTDHLVMRIPALTLAQAPAIPRMALHLLH